MHLFSFPAILGAAIILSLAAMPAQASKHEFEFVPMKADPSANELAVVYEGHKLGEIWPNKDGTWGACTMRMAFWTKLPSKEAAAEALLAREERLERGGSPGVGRSHHTYANPDPMIQKGPYIGGPYKGCSYRYMLVPVGSEDRDIVNNGSWVSIGPSQEFPGYWVWQEGMRCP